MDEMQAGTGRRLPASLSEYLVSIFAGTVSALSGAAGVAFTVLAFFLKEQTAQVTFGFLAALSIVFATYYAWAKERGTVVRLQAELTPQIKLRYENREYFVRTVDNCRVPDPNHEDRIIYTPVKWFRIELEPCSDAIAKSCRVYLRRVEYEDGGIFVSTGYAGNQQLRWTESDQEFGPMDVSAAKGQFVDVLSTDPVQNRVCIKWPPTPWIANNDLFDKPGRYRLTVTASADRSSLAVPLVLVLNWTGKWDTTELDLV